jgi:hypothetical protein
MAPEVFKQQLAARYRSKPRQFELIFRAYFYLGVITAVFAAAYFVLSLLHVNLSAEQRLALTIAGIGAAIALISRWLVATWRERALYEMTKREEDRDVVELIYTWARFEELSRQALGLGDDDVNRRSPRAIFSRLRQEGRLTDADLENLDRAIQIRNQIVHGHAPLPSELIQAATRALHVIMHKLEPAEQHHL